MALWDGASLRPGPPGPGWELEGQEIARNRRADDAGFAAAAWAARPASKASVQIIYEGGYLIGLYESACRCARLSLMRCAERPPVEQLPAGDGCEPTSRTSPRRRALSSKALVRQGEQRFNFSDADQRKPSSA
jgi:hypothetical protein